MAEIIPFDRDDFRCSGGELPHGSDEVWAFEILGRGKKAHFWRLKGDHYKSLCGAALALLTIPNGQCALFEPGNIPKCKRCMDRLRRQSAAAAEWP